MLELSPNLVGLVAVIALLAVALAACRWVLTWLAQHKSTITHAQAAAEIGFKSDPHTDLSAALDDCELFHNSFRNDRLFNFCYVGDTKDVRIRILEVQLERAQSQMLDIKIPIITTVVAFAGEELGLPCFVAQPKRLHRVAAADLIQVRIPVYLNDEFNKLYTVTTQDKRETNLERLFNTDVRGLLKEHRFVVESTGNRLILYREGKTVPNQLWKEHLALSVKLLAWLRRAWEKQEHPDNREIVVGDNGRLRLVSRL